jgi:hypothetical protein
MENRLAFVDLPRSGAGSHHLRDRYWPKTALRI